MRFCALALLLLLPLKALAGSAALAPTHTLHFDDNVDPGYGVEVKLVHDSGLYAVIGAEQFDIRHGGQSMLDITALSAGIGAQHYLIREKLLIHGQLSYSSVTNGQMGSAPEAIRYIFREELPGEEQPIWPNAQYSAELSNFVSATVGASFTHKWTRMLSSSIDIGYYFAESYLHVKYWSDDVIRDKGVWWEVKNGINLSGIRIGVTLINLSY